MAKWKQTRGREPSRERLIHQPLCNTDRQSVTSHRESYIGCEYIVGQCPAIMPRHSHPDEGRKILDPVIPTGGGQIPTMAGLGASKRESPTGCLVPC